MERQFDFKGLKEDDFEGLFIPINFMDTFLDAEDSTSMINRVTHILLPPQWSTDRELHISDILMDNIHMRGMSLMGFVWTRSFLDIVLTPTPDDVIFFTKYFGEESVMGICSSDGMMLFNITKEAFAWGKKENAKADMGRFPPQHCLKARWKSDATTPVRFLIKTFHIIVWKHFIISILK